MEHRPQLSILHLQYPRWKGHPLWLNLQPNCKGLGSQAVYSATMGVPSSGDCINVGWITRVYVPCFPLSIKTKFLTNTFWLFLFVFSIAIKEKNQPLWVSRITSLYKESTYQGDFGLLIQNFRAIFTHYNSYLLTLGTLPWVNNIATIGRS